MRRFRPENLQLPDRFDGFAAGPNFFGFAADEIGDGELAEIIPLRPPDDAA